MPKSIHVKSAIKHSVTETHELSVA